MRKTLLFISLMATITISCSKSNNTTFDGRWTFTEYYSSPGGPYGTWMAASQMFPGETYAEFHADGSIKTDVSLFKARRYEIINADSVTFHYDNGSSRKWRYELTSNTLILRSDVCIESCAWKFVKFN